jgi:SHS2 domain-containing protein
LQPLAALHSLRERSAWAAASLSADAREPAGVQMEQPHSLSPREWLDRKTRKMERKGSFEFVEADGRTLGFAARGPTLEAVFREASEALLTATVERADSVRDEVMCPLTLLDPRLDLLLSRFLNELIHLRETRRLLLHARSVELKVGAEARLHADLTGETMEQGRHRIAREVKVALTQAPGLIESTGGWEVMVSLNV